MIGEIYFFGCVVSVIVTIASMWQYLKKDDITRGMIAFYLAVILTSWFGLLVVLSCFIDDTKWGQKTIIKRRKDGDGNDDEKA